MKQSRIFDDSRTIALSFAAIAAVLAVSGPANAGEPVYTMTAIVEEAHGAKVVAGKYEQAIEKLSAARKRGADGFAAATNLCVALTKAGEVEKAEEACELALVTARNESRHRSRSSFMPEYERRKYYQNLAVALSNRGVLQFVAGDAERARKDFVAALELDAAVQAPAVNLARLEQLIAMR